MMKLYLFTPKEKKIFTNVKKIVIPSLYGMTEILTNHAESFLVLDKGNIIIYSQQEKKSLFVKKGICHIKDNNIKIFT